MPELTRSPNDIIKLNLPIKRGTQANFDILNSKSACNNGTIYICEDTGNIYLGNDINTGKAIRLAKELETSVISDVYYNDEDAIERATVKYDNPFILTFKYAPNYKQEKEFLDVNVLEVLENSELGKSYNTVEWNHETFQLIFTAFDGTKTEIDLTQAVSIATENTDTISMTISNNEEGNKLSANVNIDTNTDNLIQSSVDGMYVGINTVLGDF